MEWVKRLLVVLILLSSFTYGQSFSIGLGSSLNFVNGKNYYSNELGYIGSYEVNGTRATFGGLGAKIILGVNALIKYDMSALPVSFTTEVQYHALRGHAEQDLPNYYMNSIDHYTSTAKLDIWTLALGSRYSFPIRDLKPFVSASFLINDFGDVIAEHEVNKATTYYSDYENGMRYGFSINAGSGYTIEKKINIEIMASYNSLNQFNRRDGEEILNTIGGALNVYYLIF